MGDTERTTMFEIDPLTDSRWQEFVGEHPKGSVFHGVGWLRALAMTYGFSPVAFTTTPPGVPLANAVLFCEIRSWLTGHRFVSLPFTDHCAPLVSDGAELRAALTALRAHPRVKQSRFLEFRGGTDSMPSSCSDLCDLTARYTHHTLSLQPAVDEIFRAFHPSCVRRAIRRAERENLQIECGRSDALVQEFYRLQVETRRRHGLPPQPVSWFSNLASTMGKLLQVRVAFQGSHAVAGIVTLAYGNTMTYKYGASEARSHKLGGIPLLMWSAMQDAKTANFSQFDFGRTDLTDSSLIRFKERFGAVGTPLSYYRLSMQNHPTALNQKHRGNSVARSLFRRLPSPVLQIFGRMLYRHVG